MKTRLFELFLWLAIGSLVLPLTAQNVSELELQKSSKLNVWESVTITPEMISDSGKLLVPSLTANDAFVLTIVNVPATPLGFSLIPAGVFTMGEGHPDERPIRQVTVSAFYIAQRETTKALWDEVRAWGISRGYTDLPVGGGKADTHPVQTVTWFDVIKWCNARSVKEGLTPCYTWGGSPVWRGKVTPVVNWTANGYRLPTEAEWEKAARGGLSRKRFPFGDAISHSEANYVNHPSHGVGPHPYTSPVGSFAANGYGLHDMAGNVWEWCWDRYGIYDSGSPSDPRGPSSGTLRVRRGGGWSYDALSCRVAGRNRSDPSISDNGIGFRVVRFGSLVLPPTAQNVSELELQKSSTLNVWESVTITPEVISELGKFLVPSSGSQVFYRMKVRPLLSPAISSSPPAITDIKEGSTVTLTVRATGSAPFSYQWYVGQSGDTSQPILGATTETYTSGALASDRSYWVKVTNVAGSINSQAALVTINYAPTIVSQPASQTVLLGSKVTLTVSATGSAPFTYQWYQGDLGSTAAPVGTNAPNFTTPALAADTSYWVKITNVAGSINSRAALLTTNRPPTIANPSQPTSQTVLLGSAVTLTVNPTGSAPFSYQWYVGQSGDTSQPILGATMETYISGALAADTFYWVEVTNLVGSINSRTARVTINYLPTIVSQPTSQMLLLGSPVTLTVSATGSAPFTYQWYVGQSGDTSQPIVGATTETYTSGALASDRSFYWVRVTNVAGSIDSRAALVTINRPPTIASQPASQTVQPGSTVTLTVSATGIAPFTYQWYVGQSGDTSQPIPGATTEAYTSSVLPTDTSYWVKVTNVVGSINSRAALVTINRPLTIASQPASQTVLLGTTATLTVGATGTAPFSYQWYRGDLGSTATPVGTNAPTFTTPALAVTTKYWVKISNPFGEIQSSSVTITVQANTAPTISDIAAQNVIVGRNTGAIAFTIGDAQTDASFLTLSGSSSNTTFVSNASIVFGGSGASRTVTVTPAIGQSGMATITLTVSDGSLTANDSFILTVVNLPATPPGFSLIPAGMFTMGDLFGEGVIEERPLSLTVGVSAFYIAKWETTKFLWDQVRAWGASRGYTDLPVGSGKAINDPVQTVTWYDVIKWCNARSEKEGLTPCYMDWATGGKPLRTGTRIPDVNWTANGYRLPTEAEWEKAASGGQGSRFPWGDTISHSQANYNSSRSSAYDISPTRGYHPEWTRSGEPYTSPVTSFFPNGYGLYDMAGNVSEWCWDWYYVQYNTGWDILSDPRGPSSGTLRVRRGGSWNDDALSCRVARRNRAHPSISENVIGFRVVRSSVP